MTTSEATTAVNGNANGNGHGVDPLQRRVDEGPKGGARTWYEVLDVSPDVSPEELKVAYDRALALVEGRSIGGYLMLDPLAAESARADVEAAFVVLGDGERRAAYDQKLRSSEAVAEASNEPRKDKAKSTPPAESAASDDEVRDARAMLAIAEGQGTTEKPREGAPGSTPPTVVQAPASPPPRTSTPAALKFLAPTVAEEAPSRPATVSSPSIRFEAPLAEPDGRQPGRESEVPREATTEASRDEPSTPPVAAAATPASAAITTPPQGAPSTPPAGVLPEGEISGRLIRELREARGVSLEQLSDATKIRKPYLKAIEENDVPNLPARVYLRGFLTQIGRVLKVDRARLAEGYLQFVERNGAGMSGP